MNKEKNREGVCQCGGRLCISEVRDQEGKASASEIEFVFECQECGKSFAVANVTPTEIEIIDPDPNFIKGVESANGKA